MRYVIGFAAIGGQVALIDHLIHTPGLPSKWQIGLMVVLWIVVMKCLFRKARG